MKVSGSSNNTPGTLMDAQEHVGNLIAATGASARQCGGFINAVVVGMEDYHTKVLNEAMLAKDVVVDEQKTKIDSLTTAMAAMKTENEALVAAKLEDNKLKKKCKGLEKKLEGQLAAFAEEKNIARDNMKKRHDEELERCAEGAELRIKHAVASAVREKDEEIEELTRVNKLLRDYRRKSEGSTVSDS